MKPFLRWAGSKRRLLPILRSFWTDDRKRYVEPFMGSACFFFALQPKSALISDYNPELVHTFKAIQCTPLEVAAVLNQFPLDEITYYQLRALLPSHMDAISRAARFIYLNRFCFNGLYRTNRTGQFNVPYGGSKTGELPTASDLSGVSVALAGVQISCGDFESIVRYNVEAGDFVYLDPPFAVRNRRIFAQYGPDSFGTHDLHRLAELLEYINEIGAKFVLSYAESREAVDSFSKWMQYVVPVQRNISGFAKHRRIDSEVLVTNVDTR